MTLHERIALVDKLRAGKGTPARSDRPRGGGATPRPCRPTTKARPADRYRKCFEQAMADLEDFEARLAGMEITLLAIGMKLGLPM